jgi:hypothetical protein
MEDLAILGVIVPLIIARFAVALSREGIAKPPSMWNEEKQTAPTTKPDTGKQRLRADGYPRRSAA